MNDDMQERLREAYDAHATAKGQRDAVIHWARLWKRAAKKWRAKSAERLAVIESLLAVIGTSERTGNAVIPSELWKRVESAQKE
jgi:hypothetical protein